MMHHWTDIAKLIAISALGVVVLAACVWVLGSLACYWVSIVLGGAR